MSQDKKKQKKQEKEVVIDQPEDEVYELGQGPKEQVEIYHSPGNPIPDL